jgi:hypothetical protein
MGADRRRCDEERPGDKRHYGSMSSMAMVAGISWAVFTFWSSTTQSKQDTISLPFQ